MKKLLPLILLFIAAKAGAQFKSFFYKQSWSIVPQVVDSIKMQLPTEFVLDTIIKSKGVQDSTYTYVFKNATQSVYLKFFKTVVGRNRDLNIAGSPAIETMSIDGPYLLLFPIWKAYYDNAANLEKAQTKGSNGANFFTYYIDDSHYFVPQFNSISGTDWRIWTRGIN